jgi:hypothetical protein
VPARHCSTGSLHRLVDEIGLESGIIQKRHVEKSSMTVLYLTQSFRLTSTSSCSDDVPSQLTYNPLQDMRTELAIVAEIIFTTSLLVIIMTIRLILTGRVRSAVSTKTLPKICGSSRRYWKHRKGEPKLEIMVGSWCRCCFSSALFVLLCFCIYFLCQTSDSEMTLIQHFGSCLRSVSLCRVVLFSTTMPIISFTFS